MFFTVLYPSHIVPEVILVIWYPGHFVPTSKLSTNWLGYKMTILFYIHPSTHAPIFKALFEYQTQATLLSTFNCCGLSANLYIHWLKTPAIVYELLYFNMFEGADKRVWQLLKDFKNDKEFHYVTIKSKALIWHFNQNTPVCPSIRQSIHPSLLGTKWPNGYEIIKKGTKWLRYELTTI